MKKKVFAVALAAALLAMAVGGSLAWFTDSDKATNTFTIGSIKIVQHEKEYNDSNELVNFTQNKVLMPIVNVENPAADPNYQDKIVTVENVGRNPAYVRTSIAIPKTLNGYLDLDLDTSNGWVYSFTSNTSVDGMEYVVYTFYYNAELASGAVSRELLKGVYLYAEVDVQKNESTGNLEFCKRNETNDGFDFSGFVVQDAEGAAYPVNVLVATQAVQAEGFADAEAALDAAFGESIPEFGA